MTIDKGEHVFDGPVTGADLPEQVSREPAGLGDRAALFGGAPEQEGFATRFEEVVHHLVLATAHATGQAAAGRGALLVGPPRPGPGGVPGPCLSGVSRTCTRRVAERRRAQSAIHGRTTVRRRLIGVLRAASQVSRDPPRVCSTSWATKVRTAMSSTRSKSASRVS